MHRPAARRCGRFFVCFASMIMALFWQVSAQASSSVTACAIRWDAWYTNGATDPGRYTADTLSTPRWHHLAPLHARFDKAGKITWAASQDTFDAEIRAAQEANLCWAYVMYGANNVIDLANPLMRGLTYHRASAIKSNVRYTMMTTSGLLGRADQYGAAVEATVALMRDPNYQHVSTRGGGSKPLLLLLYDPADLAHFFSGSLLKMKDVIDAIRRSCAEARLGDPYIVIVFGPPNGAETVRRALGADGISEYIAGKRSGGVQSWAAFEPSMEADWDAYATASPADAIPTLRSGADIRARCEIPPPFDHRFAAKKCDSFVVNPSIPELTFALQKAVGWIETHRTRDPANLLLVYSWSECDESGNCLMPSIGDPSGQKLKALAETLKRPLHASE
jgi:hypothetical protein